MSYTRRTHVVRITDPGFTPNPNDPKSQGNYVDVEVLDAIAFRVEQNKEVILSMDATKAVPYIVDETGGNHGKTPDSGATQRTHMKRVTSTDGKSALDIEVVDCWSATDQNGESWILDMQPGSSGGTAFNISDFTGDVTSTRREHNEIISVPFGKTKADAKGSYVTSVRTDNLAFRKANGSEVILSCPSSDDPNAVNVDFSRASTYLSPQGYDPKDTSSAAVVPPSLSASGDNHNYVCFVKGSDGKSMGILTKDEKIDMGPFWWIRKINTGGGYLVLIGYAQQFYSPTGKNIGMPMDQSPAELGDLSSGDGKYCDSIDVSDNALAGIAVFGNKFTFDVGFGGFGGALRNILSVYWFQTKPPFNAGFDPTLKFQYDNQGVDSSIRADFGFPPTAETQHLPSDWSAIITYDGGPGGRSSYYDVEGKFHDLGTSNKCTFTVDATNSTEPVVIKPYGS
jgi:hypothetical protein